MAWSSLNRVIRYIRNKTNNTSNRNMQCQFFPLEGQQAYIMQIKKMALSVREGEFVKMVQKWC